MSSAEPPTDRDPPAPTPTNTRAGSVHGRGPAGARLLVVDDDPAVQLVLARALARFGYQVLIAGSGPQALAQLDEESGIVAVLSDVDMTPMTGPELVRRIHQRHPGMPILFITGHPGAIDPRDDPSVAVVTKPIDLGRLREAVDTVVHGLARGQRRSTPVPGTGPSSGSPTVRPGPDTAPSAR